MVLLLYRYNTKLCKTKQLKYKMSVKKNDVVLQFRVDSDFAALLHELAGEKAAKLKRRVTLSEIIRIVAQYGYPVALAENRDPHLVDVLQKSHTQAAREIAISALENTIKTLQDGSNN